MTPTDPLANLKDIIEPPPPGGWPPGPAWWVCAVLLVGLAYVGYWYYRRHRQNTQDRRDALRALADLRKHDDLNDREFAVRCSAYLRRAARLRYPEAPRLAGLAWLEFLNRTGHTNAFTTDGLIALGEASYRPTEVTIDRDYALACLQRWVEKNL